MAELKTGTTIGGNLVWTQGNFPLNPAGDQVLYKTYKIYTEFNKPQAHNNDFVSKSTGGTFNNAITVVNGINISDSASNTLGSVSPGNGDNATLDICNVDIKSHWGIGFRQANNPRTIVFDVRSGYGGFKILNANTFEINASQSNLANSATRKDYVDTVISNVTSNANNRVMRSGDIMTGSLTAPNLISANLATSNNQVPQLAQVVQRGVVIDYGTF